ncbi:GNAT family N-acetyltransferase [Nocardioides sp.]|uniref:GNAT family N-acetyltransferase n=1 Tax=Nocardioides sp. TaxID=35761 RepID=UPI00352852EC
MQASLEAWDVYVVRVAGRLVGSVRARLDDREWDIGRLMVAPDLRGRGLGRALLDHIMAVAPPQATSYRLFTGKQSEANLRRYKRAGFSVREVLDGRSGPVVLWRPRR